MEFFQIFIYNHTYLYNDKQLLAKSKLLCSETKKSLSKDTESKLFSYDYKLDECQNTPIRTVLPAVFPCLITFLENILMFFDMRGYRKTIILFIVQVKKE